MNSSITEIQGLDSENYHIKRFIPIEIHIENNKNDYSQSSEPNHLQIQIERLTGIKEGYFEKRSENVNLLHPINHEIEIQNTIDNLIRLSNSKEGQNAPLKSISSLLMNVFNKLNRLKNSNDDTLAKITTNNDFTVVNSLKYSHNLVKMNMMFNMIFTLVGKVQSSLTMLIKQQ